MSITRDSLERGTMFASRSFAESADEHLRAGRALIRRWKEMHDVLAELSGGPDKHDERLAGDQQPAPGTDLVLEHEHAELILRDGMYETASGDEPMDWHVKHDQDASKEVWLLFENEDGRFPLYPGETTRIGYSYTVREHKWGLWWQRAIRLPTRRLSMTVMFPARLQPAVWGITTSLAAEASPFPTPIVRQNSDDQVIFTWSTDDPPLHARYRMEWKFKSPDRGEAAEMDSLTPGERMRSLEIAQEGEPVLAEVARP
ncbi:MAG TPA: hypothetical protein VGH27_30555 [Streptosporangiaceae bacterium]